MITDYFLGEQANIKYSCIVAIDIDRAGPSTTKATVVMKKRDIIIHGGEEVDRLTRSFSEYIHAQCKYRRAIFWIRMLLMIILLLAIYTQVK